MYTPLPGDGHHRLALFNSKNGNDDPSEGRDANADGFLYIGCKKTTIDTRKLCTFFVLLGTFFKKTRLSF